MSNVVYVAWYDNGEEWDDNCQDIGGVFSTYENAAQYIEDSGYARQVDSRGDVSWRGIPYRCRAGKTHSNECCGSGCPFYDPEEPFGCKEEESLYDNELNRSFYIIREMYLDIKAGENGEVVF